MTDAPVLIIGFKRPDLLRRVLGQVMANSGGRLYVALDGPRVRPGEPELVEKCRQLVAGAGARVHATQFQETNLGCQRGVTAAIDWFFQHEASGIILEDDCLPHPDFFAYARELLITYRSDPTVAMISGTNLVGQWRPDISDYHLAWFGGVWGWATWRDWWARFTLEVGPQELAAAEPSIRRRLSDPLVYDHFMAKFDLALRGTVDTWDFHWDLARLAHGGLTCIPARNLVANVGFGPDATHTTAESSLAELPTYPVACPLRPPVGVDADLDRAIVDRAARPASLLSRLTSRLRHIMKHD